MDMNLLVDLVYKELTNKLAVEKRSDSICIIANNRVQEIESIFNDSYYVDYFSEDMENKEYKITIVPSLTTTMLANVANGLGTTKDEQFILSQLLRGGKVIVLKNGVEYYRYKTHAPNLLYKVFEEYERRLKGFGIPFLSSDKLLSDQSEEPEEVVKIAAVKTFTLTKRLISESDLQRLYLKNIKEITVNEKSIITPLAQDYIRTHQLVITKESRKS
jgi:ethanolamine utilization protein